MAADGSRAQASICARPVKINIQDRNLLPDEQNQKQADSLNHTSGPILDIKEDRRAETRDFGQKHSEKNWIKRKIRAQFWKQNTSHTLNVKVWSHHESLSGEQPVGGGARCQQWSFSTQTQNEKAAIRIACVVVQEMLVHSLNSDCRGEVDTYASYMCFWLNFNLGQTKSNVQPPKLQSWQGLYAEWTFDLPDLPGDVWFFSAVFYLSAACFSSGSNPRFKSLFSAAAHQGSYLFLQASRWGSHS